MEESATVTSSSAAEKPKVSKEPRKRKRRVAKVDHPTYTEMIVRAVRELKERRGSSRQAILKFLMTNNKLGSDTKMISAHMRMALKRLVEKNVLERSAGIGASGRFRLGERSVKQSKRRRLVAKPKTGEKKARKLKTSSPKKPKRQTTSNKSPSTKTKMRRSTPAKKTEATIKKASPAKKKRAVIKRKPAQQRAVKAAA